MKEELTCPVCKFQSDKSDFPDLFYFDDNNEPTVNEQYNLLKELWDKGYNIVTCGECGMAFIHRI